MSGLESANGLSQSLENQTLDNTLGAAFLGIVAATFLFGITTLQVYLYYHRYSHDSGINKVAVGTLWVLDCVHLLLIVHAVYYYAIKGFGNVLTLSVVVWSVKLEVTINVIIMVSVQSLYAYRVWILGGYHHAIIGYIVAGVVIGGFGLGAALAYKIFTIHTFQESQMISGVIDISLVTSTAIDFALALAMCLYLHKSRGSQSQLNSRIGTIMQYSLGSGLFTSACSLSTLFAFILVPNTWIFLGLQFLSTKFYVGSFLAMLNARQRQSESSASERPFLHAKRGTTLRFRTSTLTHSNLYSDPCHVESVSSLCPQSQSDSTEAYAYS